LQERIESARSDINAPSADIVKLDMTHAKDSDLIVEAKIESLISPATPVKYEASGVALYDHSLFIVIDNQFQSLIKIPITESGKHMTLGPKGQLVGEHDFIKDSKAGFEGITIIKNGAADMMYLLQEVKWKKSTFDAPSKPEISTDASAISRFYPQTGQIDHRGFINELIPEKGFATENKGFEGIANLSVSGSTYLLTLCEGNSCLAKDQNLKNFDGIVTVFAEKKKAWKPIGRLSLGNKVPFLDYSDMDIHWEKVQSAGGKHIAHGKILITSQMDSAIWSADMILTIGDGAAAASFSNEKFFILGADLGYCNVEGITWLNTEKKIVAIASDAAKKDEENKKCLDKEQSIHVVSLDRGQ
jgi:hypothetical protein